MVSKFVSTLDATFSYIEDEIEDKYEVVEEIGEGSYAKVFKIKKRNCEDEKMVEYQAMKRLSINPLTEQIQELSQLKMLKSDHIIEFHGYSIKDSELNLVMGLCPGSLRKLITQNVQFSEQRILRLIVQITNAMIELSGHNIMHLDIKPENILYENPDYFKICDFGCSKILANMSRAFSFIPVQIEDFNFGTPMYMPPQVQKSDSNSYKNSVDMWSFGVVLYELMFHRFPFQINQQTMKYQKQEVNSFLNGDFQIDFSTNKSRVCQIIKTMLHPKPEKRWTWKCLKKQLIDRYERYEVEFKPLKEAAKNQIKMTLIFFNLILILEKQITEETKFSNILGPDKILFTISLMCLTNAKSFPKFKELFCYKYETKLPKKYKQDFLFLEQLSKSQFEKNINIFENQTEGNDNLVNLVSKLKKSEEQSLENVEMRLMNELYEIFEKFKEKENEPEQIKILRTFYEQAIKNRRFFCMSHTFTRTGNILASKELFLRS